MAVKTWYLFVLFGEEKGGYPFPFLRVFSVPEGMHVPDLRLLFHSPTNLISFSLLQQLTFSGPLSV